MTRKHPKPDLRMIPLDTIEVLNPRDRNAQKFEGIVRNIQSIGLKKPITVTPRPGQDGAEHYLLICGEGRLKAFRELGENFIPALVVEASDEDAFVMSLAENVARRKGSALELLAGIGRLQEQGYDKKAIAEKTGLTLDYVHGILQLLGSGEERLLVAVESGRIPLTAALVISGAGNNDRAVQVALQEAYETGQLRGHQLLHARRVIERRQALGKTLARSAPRKPAEVTTSSLVRNYQKEVERQKLLVRKAETAQQRLLFVVEALRELMLDESFTVLLRAERLDTLPKYLSDRVWPGGHTS